MPARDNGPMPQDDPDVLDLIETHLAASPITGVRLVGIDGPSGSGKSTLARGLAERLGSPVIKIDDFVSWSDFAGWWPRFEQQVVQPLLAGHDATYQQRDWQDHEFGDELGSWRTVAWAPVVIIEGVTSTRAAVADSLACRVWVEAPTDLRLTRGLARDGVSHLPLWEQWMIDEKAFFERDGARQRADFVVSGVDGGVILRGS